MSSQHTPGPDSPLTIHTYPWPTTTARDLLESHAALLEALRWIADDITANFSEYELTPDGDESLIGMWRDKARAALAQAQPEES